MSKNILYKRCKYSSDVFYALVEKCGFPIEEASNLLNSIPDVDIEKEFTTVEEKPVVHGEWLYKKETYNTCSAWKCSNCGECYGLPFVKDEYNFCPECGADMRGGKND